MYSRLIILLTYFSIHFSTAQNSELWLMNKNGFNDKFIIDWRTDPPSFNNVGVLAPDSFTPNYSVSDSCGNILFFTDLFSIMDRNLADTLLADSITGNYSQWNESGGIVKIPNSDSIYLIIRTNYSQLLDTNFNFIPFDLDSSIGFALWSYNGMTLRHQLISKQNKLYDFYSDQLLIIKHGNNRDYWLLGRNFDGEILVWSIDSTGIESVPTIFSGSPIRTDLTAKYPNSTIYSSPSGEYIFYVHHDENQNYLCIGEFDRSKGLFKEIKTIPIPIFDPSYSNVQEIRSIIFREECNILYYVEQSNHNRLFKLQFDHNFNLIDDFLLYSSQDYTQNNTDEILLHHMKLFRNKIYFTNATYNGSVYEATVKRNMSTLELSPNCTDEDEFKLLNFETGGLTYRNGPPSNFPEALGGEYNGEKTILIENVCLGDTSHFKSVNTSCETFLEWYVLKENEISGESFQTREFDYVFKNIGLHKIEYRTNEDTVLKFIRIDEKLPEAKMIDTVICGNSEIVLGADENTNNSVNFKWNNGKREKTQIVEQAGHFKRTSYNSCNSVTDTWNVVLLPDEINGVSDSIIHSCNDAPLSLKIPEGNWEVKWEDKNLNNQRNIYVNGYYEVEISNSCFDTTFSFEVYFEENNKLKEVNVFTPNGDGINDLFNPYENIELIDNFSIKIYNRWGGLVFKTDNPQVFWDAKNVPNSEYFYSISFKQCKELKKFKGNVRVLK